MQQQPELGIALVAQETCVEWRERYRAEMNAQIVHDSWHARGFTDLYACSVNRVMVGYAAVGGPPRESRDIVKEFYLDPEFRPHGSGLVQLLLQVSGARWVEAQTNDRQLMPHLVTTTSDWSVEAILFEDSPAIPSVMVERATFRRLSEADRAAIFPHTHEPVGEWGLERSNRIVATGGLAFHYNAPYADLFMEVEAGSRRQGIGTALVAELRRVCRATGHEPAARCRPANEASQRTLIRAGMAMCGHVLRGRVLGSPHG